MGSGASTEDVSKQVEELKAALEAENNDISRLIDRTARDLDSLTNARLDIAVTGETGSGKSSLVNALRGMTDYEEGAAKTGVTQTTMEPIKYAHPTFPNVIIWDLPGSGTREFKVQEYLKRVNFMKYDFFIIVASACFKANDVQLAQEIKKMNKKFYYVLSKLDVQMESERRAAEIRKEAFNEGETLQKIREHCWDYLAKAGESHHRFFLVSSHYRMKFDFWHLQKVLECDLDEIKRYTLVTAFSNDSKEILKKKKAYMKVLVWKVALVSSATWDIPFPDLPVACNIPFLEKMMRHFGTVFGLDENSLCRLAKQVGKPVLLLNSAIKKTRIASQINREFIKPRMKRACENTERGFMDFLPLLRSLLGGGNSPVALSHMLHRFLDDAEEDAVNVLAEALVK